MTAYQAALAGGATPAIKAVRSRGAPGTFDDLMQRYLESSNYVRLSPGTKQAYQLTAEKLIREEGIGQRLVAQMKREHVSRMVAKRHAMPGAANNALGILRVLVRFAIDMGWREDDPTLRVKRLPAGEHHSWTDQEIAAFEARWPTGTRERVAFALLLDTGQRLDDVRLMSWRDLEGPGINVVQGKTKTRLWIPLHPDLAAVLQQWPREHVTILNTRFGQPFTRDGFGAWMASRIERAGLPDRCVSHGLRKAAARRLADAGCSVHQIAAITGHQSLKEIERYTKAAEQRRLARDAIDRLQGQAANKDSQP
jgi:integrase